MGWFLSDKPKRRTAKKPATKSAPRITRAGVVRTLRIAGWAVLLGGIGSGWYFGERQLRAHAAHERAALPQVELLDLPPWMMQWVVDDLRRTVAAAVDPNPLDQLSLQEVYHELESNPWVRSVNSVVRRSGGVIQISAAYRRPAALIAAEDGYHLIDHDGVRLPAVYNEREAAKLPYPVLVGVRGAAAEAGAVWPGGDVQAGLALAKLVVAQPWRAQVKSIDVVNFDGRKDPASPHLCLRTKREGVVGWGRAPGYEGVHEPPATTKLQHVIRVMQQSSPRGLIDDGGIVHVYGDRVFSYKSDRR